MKNMKRTVRVILAALLLCALLLTACDETAQKNTPTADPSEETQEPAGTPEVSGGQSAEPVELPSPTPGGGDSPSPSDTPAVETDPPVVETDPPVVETDPPVVETDPPVVETDPPVVEPSPVRLGETPDAGREYLDKLYFLGDSTTYWMGQFYAYGYSEYLIPASHIWTGPTGTMTLAYYAAIPIVYETGEQVTLREAVELAKPEYLVITLGVNGVGFMNEEWFVRVYTEIIELVKEASPETKIICNSIYPICTFYPYYAEVNNDKIRAANGWIEQIAADTGTRFINSYESVVDEEGNLPVNIALNDGMGLHMNGEGFKKVMYYFRTHAYI